jgi:hypothetical protein
LIINADAMLPSAVTLQLLEPIPGRNPQEFQRCSGVELGELAAGDGFNIGKPGDPTSPMQRFGLTALEIKNCHG